MHSRVWRLQYRLATDLERTTLQEYAQLDQRATTSCRQKLADLTRQSVVDIEARPDDADAISREYQSEMEATAQQCADIHDQIASGREHAIDRIRTFKYM